MGRRTQRRCALLCCIALLALPFGCTSESLRVALEVQRRADAVEHAVFEQQRDALRVLLYRDLLRRLEHTGPQLNDQQRSAVNEVWNDRDLIEFWAIQHERARALRLIGVDAKLYGDQSIADLLYKSLAAKANRAEHGLAAEMGSKVAK
jgi:hypothetical protein